MSYYIVDRGGPVAYGPYTLVGAYREATGCGNVNLVHASGRVVLRDAGDIGTRRLAIRSMRRARYARRCFNA